MKLPKQIVVGPHIYTVTESPLSPHEGNYGETRALGLELFVSPEMHPSQRAETLLHEILHAVLKDSGIDQTDQEEERVVALLSPRLLDTMRRNRKTFNRIIDGGTSS